MEQTVDLGVDGRADPRVRVAQDGHGEAVGEVEVAAAVGVVQAMALAAGPGALEVAAERRATACVGAVLEGRAVSVMRQG